MVNNFGEFDVTDELADVVEVGLGNGEAFYMRRFVRRVLRRGRTVASAITLKVPISVSELGPLGEVGV